MKKSTILMALSLMAGTAFAQVAKSPASALEAASQNVSLPVQSLRSDVRQPRFNFEKQTSGTSSFAKKVPARVITPPSPDDKVMSETPEGEMKLYAKQGLSYGYSWFTGMISQYMYSGLSNIVTSPDGKKMYIQNPIYFFYDSEENWIEGDVEDNVLTITLPQLISYSKYEYDDGEVEEYYDYLLKLEFVASEEDEEMGWYYPTEDQTYKFRINEDGSLTSLEGENMLGQCAWFDAEEEGETGAYSWQGNGDIIVDAYMVTEKALEVPESVKMEDWQMITGFSYRGVKVGVDGDNMYVSGLFSSMEDASVVGKISDGKVHFAGPQYLGPYYYNSTLAYFLTGDVEIVEENGEQYKSFRIDDEMVFEYDADKHILSSEGAYCISTCADKVAYYAIVDDPYICIPDADFTVAALQNPVIKNFYDVDEEYGYDAAISFDFPVVDADRHVLNPDNLYYEVIVDDEPFTFYNDVYTFPEGIEEVTQIPFYFEDEDLWVEDPDDEEGGYTIWSSIYYSGINHYIELRGVRDFENLGIRTLYRNDEEEIYSDIVWIPGYESGSGVEGVSSVNEIMEIRYYDLMGKRVATPANGVFVRQAVYSDGSVRSVKVVR